MALAERVRIPFTRRAAERRGLVVAWRRRRRFGWEVPLGREEPPHAIPPSAPAATPHALDQLVLAALAPTAPGLAPLGARRRTCSVPGPAARHERAPDLYLL
jgi:hypothetical protein